MNKTSDRKTILTRGIEIMTVLAPHMIAGLTVSEIAKKTGYSVSVVCRDLESLSEIGWASRQDNRWTLTTRPVGLARACEESFRIAQEKHSDFQRNATARAKRILEAE